MLDLTTDLFWLNCAVSVALRESIDVVATALLKLGHVFAAHSCMLRFEFNPLPWPALPAALERYSLRLQTERPLMICTPATFTLLAAPEVTARLLDAESPDMEIRAASMIQRLGSGGKERARCGPASMFMVLAQDTY